MSAQPIDAVNIPHTQFVQRYKAGEIVAHVDGGRAMRAIEAGWLPRRYRAAQTLWSWVWLLSIVGFIALAIFWHWWAVFGLLVITPGIRHAVKESAGQGVMEQALEDRILFERAVDAGVLRLSQKV